MRPILALLVTAGPALAHDGPHLHPHDGGAWLAVVGVLAAAGVALVLWGRR